MADKGVLQDLRQLGAAEGDVRAVGAKGADALLMKEEATAVKGAGMRWAIWSLTPAR